MLIKELRISNNNGDSIEFGHNFKLDGEIDLSGLGANVNISESTRDGATYQSTMLGTRDFSIYFFIDRTVDGDFWVEEKRQEAYRVFNPKQNPMRFDLVTSAGKEYYLNAELLAAPIFAVDNEDESNIKWQNGFLQFNASDPYIYAKDVHVDIASWVGAFSFPLNIPQDMGIEMGYRSQNLIANAVNTGQSEAGMIVRFKALATVVNPAIVNVNTYEFLKINTTMIQGDVIEISTYTGRKGATLIRNNVKSNIFNKIDLMSKFLQLEPGDNLFRYEADDGVDNLEVDFVYTPKMVGV